MVPPDFNAKTITNMLASFAAVFLFFAFCYLLNEEFVCPCDPIKNTMFCFLYITLPFIIFLEIMMFMDNSFLPICEPEHCYAYCSVILKRLLRAFTAGLIWIVTALIDGDFLICLQTTSPNITVSTEQPACKLEPTREEFAEIRYFKSVSLVSGLLLLSWLLFIWAFFLWCSKQKMQTFYTKALYDEYLLEESDYKLKKELRELAKVNAESKVRAKLIQIRNDVGPTNPRAGYEDFGTFERLIDS